MSPVDWHGNVHGILGWDLMGFWTLMAVYWRIKRDLSSDFIDFPPGFGLAPSTNCKGPSYVFVVYYMTLSKNDQTWAWAPQVMAKESDLESRTFLGIPSTCSMKSGKVVWGYHPVVQLVWEENFLEGYHSLLQWTNPAGGYFLTSK